MPTPPTPFIAWHEEYNLKNQLIDGQHQQMVKLVGELHGSVITKEGRISSVQRLDKLYDFSKAHFAIEEQLLRLRKCPRYLVHKAAHEGLAHALKGLREEVARGERKLTLEFVELIKLWLIDHFGEFDGPSASYLRAESTEPEKTTT